MYQHSIPKYENAVDLGAKWLTTLWYDSSEDVWWEGHSLAISLVRFTFVNSGVSFSLDFVSAKRERERERESHDIVNCNHMVVIPICVRFFSHFLFLSLPYNFPCKHLGKSLLCPRCTLWRWLSRDNHLALLIVSLLSGVEATHQ